MQSAPYYVDTIFLGRLARETIINRNKEVWIDRPGGNLLYAAFAHKLWGKNPGLLAKVGTSYSESWINHIAQQGFNTQGIQRISQDCDHRDFFFINSEGEISSENPQKYFLDSNRPFPKLLLGYSNRRKVVDSKRFCDGFSLKPQDIPVEYFNCQNLALCPLDYVSHSLIPIEFRARNTTRVFIHGSQGYMHSAFFREIQPLVCGAELFFTSFENARALFLGKKDDPWEILEFLSSNNVEISIISHPQQGYFIFILPEKKKFFLPAYPVKIVDPVGAEDAFFGGYIASYLKHFDPLRASVSGAIAASIKQEGSTAQYLLDTLPELAAGRLEKHMEEIKAC